MKNNNEQNNSPNPLFFSANSLQYATQKSTDADKRINKGRLVER